MGIRSVRAVAVCALAILPPSSSGSVLNAQRTNPRVLLERAERLRAEDTKASLEGSIATYLQALAAARQLNDRIVEARAVLGQGIALTWLGRSSDAVSVLDDAVRRLQGVGDQAAETEALVYRAVAEGFSGSNAKAVEILKRALPLARAAGDRRVEALALNALGWARAEAGVLTDAEKRTALEEAIRIQRALPNQHDLSMSLSGLGLHVYLTGDGKQAIPILDEALAVARQGKSPRAQGQALSILGDIYARSDPEKALALYREAIPLTRLAGHRIQEPYTLRGLGSVLVNRGRVREALGIYREALAAAQDVNDRWSEGYSWHNVGVALATLGERDQALACYERALAIHRANADHTEEATTLLGLASLQIGDGNSIGALEHARNALDRYRAVRDEARQVWALTYVGLATLNLGRYREAIEAFGSALQLAEKTGTVTEQVATARWLGTGYGLIGDRAAAIKYLERAVAIGESTQMNDNVAVALAHLANVELVSGERPTARRRLERALALAKRSDIKMAEVRVLDALAELELQSGRPADAVPHLERSLSIRQLDRTVLDVGVAYIKLGRAHRALGAPDVALEWYRRALLATHAASASATESLALVELMRLWRDRGAVGLATFYGKQAVNRFQQTRADLRALDYAVQHAYVNSRSGVYRELADILIGAGRLPEAQQVLDLLKEQEYLDFVRRDAGEDPRTRTTDLTPAEAASDTRYREITSRAAALGRERGELLAIRNRSVAEDRRLSEVERDLSVANEAFGRWPDSLGAELNTPAAAARTYGLREAQGLMEDLRELGPGTVAIYTLVGAERYRVVLITPDARVAGEYPIRAQELNRRVLEYRQALENPHVDPRPLAQELYRILVAPIAPALIQARAETLMWSLDGVLRYLPVSALHDGKQYLIERYRSVVFTPASNSRLKDDVTKTWHGVGAGVSIASGDFTALPAVAEELRGIFKTADPADTGLIDGRVLLDEAFTADAFRITLRERYPVVHIATHFRFRPGNETDSFLLLGDGTHMTLAEIRNAPNLFSGVELLTLSACNTAVGDSGASGSEVEGFAVIAQRQGAKAVLASLWSVADASTRTFMEEFYRARVVNRRTKAEAFQDAQLALLHGRVKVADSRSARGLTKRPGTTVSYVPPDHAPYSHPFYWAPFTLIGNWK